MAKSIFPKEMMESCDSCNLTPELIAAKFSFFHEQFHLLHLQTISFAEHKALNIYEDILDIKDEVLEKIQGYTGKRIKAYKIDPIKDYSPGLSLQMASEGIMFADSLEEYADANKMPDVCNIAQSLSGKFAQLKYLLSLS